MFRSSIKLNFIQGETLPYTSPKDIWGEVTFVDRPELAVASAEDERHYLGTGGLMGCIGLALYDPDNRIGAVGHELFTPRDVSRDRLITINDNIAWPIVEGNGNLREEEKKVVGHVTVPYNITPETHFALYMDALIDIAKQEGGESFHLWLFKTGFNYTFERYLKPLVESHLTNLYKKQVIRDVTNRSESGFALDVRTGNMQRTYC